ncbi:MAG: DUF4190 domain-containing protein [Actinomycetota bacterium]
MPFCSNCGRDLSPSAVACPNWGHPGPGAPAVVAAAARSGRIEGFAIASLACSVAGFVFIPIIGSILGIVFGGVARKHIAEDPSLEGDSLARAGTIVGWVGIGVAVLLIAMLILFAFVMGDY